MKSSLFLLFICILGNVHSQFRTYTNYSVLMDTVNVGQYKVPDHEKEYEIVKLEVGFGDIEIANKAELKKLENAAIISIDLVYTQFPKEEDFKKLNTKRLEYLHLFLPEVFLNSAIKWRLVAQMGAHSVAKASSFFHGFVIVYRPAPTPESVALETKSFEKTVKSKQGPFRDSTIFKVFERNKKKFANAAIVSDFTGSMSPYIAQVLIWYELNFSLNKFSEFVFFNDGDMTPDDKKKAGNVGGIYYCSSKNKDTVLSTALKCIRSGSGGDLPENNIEAAIFALKKNPKIPEIIMVADNYATPRDLALVKKVGVPVRVILCGTSGGINPLYLELAYATKGSVHTIERDIERLMDLQEGKVITIGSERFSITKGKFTKVY